MVTSASAYGFLPPWCTARGGRRAATRETLAPEAAKCSLQLCADAGGCSELLDGAVCSQKGKNALLSTISANAQTKRHAALVIVSIILNI